MNRAKFYNYLRRRNSGVFGTSLSQSQVEGMEGLLNAWPDHGTDDPRHLAYILGGVYHETGGKMIPVREGFAKTDAGARRIVAKRRYGKPAGPYGHVYYGRGRIQNTWLDNMEKLKARFGYDFVKHPDLLLDPKIDTVVTIVGHIEGIWTTRKLSDYINAKGADYINARRIVNGTDKAAMIADYAKAFLAALTEAGGVPIRPSQKPTQAPKPQPRPVQRKTDKPVSASRNGAKGGIAALVMVVIVALAGWATGILEKIATAFGG